MRIVLISPYDDRCYGLRIIASFLRQHGHEVWLLILKKYISRPVTLEEYAAVRHPPAGSFSAVTETTAEDNFICCLIEPITEAEYQRLTEKLSEIRPDLIGISLTTPTAVPGREITKRIKRAFPRVPVIWGGIHPSIDPDQCIQWTDMVCLADGEYPLLDLANDPDRTDVPSVWRRKNGKIYRNPVRPLEQDLDVFPFASWGENEFLIDWDRIHSLPASDRTYFRGITFIMTQRGCPFSCSYCYNHARKALHKGERYVRRRSVDNVIAECEIHVRDFGFTSFDFDDDIFVKDLEWIEEFADKYPRRVALPFGGYSHPLLSTEPMFSLLAEAGMCYTTIGVESGSKYILEKVYHRRHGIEKTLALARLGEKYGLALIYEVLSNCDYESEEDCLDTLRLLTRLPKTHITRVLGLAVFPPLKIAKLDLPKPCLSEETFEFWNTLYLLTHFREIPGEQLLALSQDQYLKAHPDILHSIARVFNRMEQQKLAHEATARDLQAQLNDVSVRGLLRYTKRLIGRALPRPLADRIRTILNASRGLSSQPGGQ